MVCCGGKRSQWQQVSEDKDRENPLLEKRLVPPETVIFEYTGLTRMFVKGPMTGRTYRFGATGQRVAIDRRDMPSVTAVPNLKRL